LSATDAFTTKGAAALGRDLAKANLYKIQLEDIGFVDVHKRIIHVPGGPWPSGDKAKLIGVYTANAFHTGVVDSFKNFLVAVGDMSAAEVDSLTTQVKKDIRDASIKWYIPMLVQDVMKREESRLMKLQIRRVRKEIV
jgi:hypothetical protein